VIFLLVAIYLIISFHSRPGKREYTGKYAPHVEAGPVVEPQTYDLALLEPADSLLPRAGALHLNCTSCHGPAAWRRAQERWS